MVSVMPSSSVASKRLTLEQYYDAHARYRSTRHHHGYRYRTRHVRTTPIPERSSNVTPTPEVAATGVEPLGRQDPVRWTWIDVSDILKPTEFITFPQDPGTFKLPADPPNTDSLLPKTQTNPKTLFYFFALIMLSILGTGMSSELRKARTCHKSYAQGIGSGRKRPTWMPKWVWRRREALSKLT